MFGMIKDTIYHKSIKLWGFTARCPHEGRCFVQSTQIHPKMGENAPNSPKNTLFWAKIGQKELLFGLNGPK